jgi:hypothetical protein
MLLSQEIESHVPHRSHIVGSIFLPDAAAVGLARDVSRPRPCILHSPRLATHRDAGGGRARQPGNGEAGVTCDGGVLMRHSNRFYSHHGLQPRPFRQVRQGCEGGAGPDSPPYGPAGRVIEGIKAVLGRAPGPRGCAGRLQGLCDRSLGRFVMALQGPERVATWVPDGLRAGRLTSHRIHGDKTALEG